MTLSIVIDPGGIPGVRDGINLEVFPESLTDTREKAVVGKTANSSLIISSRNQFMDLEWTSLLTSAEYAQVDALYTFNINRASQGFTAETVIYNLFEPFNEIAQTRTRFLVPSTAVLDQDVGTSSTRWRYWVAQQGNLEFDSKRAGDCHLVTFKFVEGTLLTSSDEP